MPARTPGPEGGWIGGLTLIGEVSKCQRGRRAPKRMNCEIPHQLGGERSILYKGLGTPLSSRCVLKTLRGSPKGKAQNGQYLLAVGVGRYKSCLVFGASFIYFYHPNE